MKQPVACTLGAQDMAERRERWARLGRRAGAGVATTDDGLRLMFRAEPGVEADLRELAALERECCAFADWTVAAAGDRVVLDVTSQDEMGVVAVQAMFAGLR